MVRLKTSQMSCVALASTLAGLSMAGAAPDKAPGSPGATPVVTAIVAGVVGAPTIVRASGDEAVAAVGATVGIGDALVTDGSSRVAITVARSDRGGLPDVLLLGSGSSIDLLSPESKSPTGDLWAPLVARVRGGSFRAVVRGFAAGFALRTGDLTLYLTEADTAGSYDADADGGRLLVARGSVVMTSGTRKIKTLAGLERMVIAGQVKGARRSGAADWSEAVAMTSVPDVDVAWPAPARAASAPPAQTRPRTAPGVGIGADTSASTRPAPPTTPVPRPSPPESPSLADPTDSDLVYVRMTTSMGAIELELDRARAPVTVKNFLAYVDNGYYHGTIFHRVMSNFMIQGGGFDAAMQKKETGASIANEWKNGLENFRGTIAMARLGRQPDSATSQFFINVKDNASLDQPRDGAGYAVFGKVVGGMDVVDLIRLVKIQQQGRHANVPVTPIVIEKTERIDPDESMQ